MTVLNTASAVRNGAARAAAVYAGVHKVWPAAGPPLAPYPAAVMADLPLAYYRFAEASVGAPAADASGNGHAGTYGSATFTTFDAGPPAIAGRSMWLAGQAGQGMTFPQSVALAAKAAVTFEWWNVVTGFAYVKAAAVFSVGNQGSPNFCQGRAPSSDYNASFDYGVATGPSVPYMPFIGDWVHVVMVYDPTALAEVDVDDPEAQAGGAKQIYLNGAWQVSVTNATPNVALSGGQIGRGTTDVTGYSGVAEFAIYDHALTADRILAHYQKGIGQ